MGAGSLQPWDLVKADFDTDQTGNRELNLELNPHPPSSIQNWIGHQTTPEPVAKPPYPPPPARPDFPPPARPPRPGELEGRWT